MRLRNISVLIIIVFLAVFAAQTALAQEGGEFSGSKLEIVYPKDGEIITGDEILLNLKFSPESGNHAHIWLDEQNPSESNARTLENPGAFLFRDVLPGEHAILVELAGGDHKSLDPEQKITLKVKSRSAADVTAEEIAQALSQVKPAENANKNSNTDCAEKGGCDGQSHRQLSSPRQSLPLIIIIGVIGVIIIAGGIGFYIIRLKK